MLCQFCKRDPNPIIMVPSRWKFGTAINVPACQECAIKEGIFCLRHDASHMGFDGDDSTVCPYCIEDEVQAGKEGAESLYKRLCQGLPRLEWLELKEAAMLSSAIMGYGNQMSVLRFVLTKAHRLHLPIEVIVGQVLQEGTASKILPTTLFA